MEYTQKARVLAALRGELVDRLPYVPRLDLWYLANSTAGTLPSQYAGAAMNEIARAEGWAFHHRFCDNQLDPALRPLYLHRGINVFYSRDTVFDVILPRDVEVQVHRDGARTRVAYHTPLGTVSTITHYDADSQRHGITSPAVVEHLIKSPRDYAPAGYLFEHMDVAPNFARFASWADAMGDDGLAICVGCYVASPFHWIQHDLVDATLFFLHYTDHRAEMDALAERIAPLQEKMLRILCDSPAEVVWWGANFDDMITFPPYFAQHIQPWLRKVADRLRAAGKLMLSHTDGENRGLMDLIRDSGIDIAESICPAPMTQVSLAEYYRHWGDRLTLYGGIPSTVLMPGTAEADFEAYMDELFRAVAPGRRMVIGVADEVPPSAVFSRLQRIGERVEREGRLPLQAGAFRPAPSPQAPSEAAAEPGVGAPDSTYEAVRGDVFKGRHRDIERHVRELLDRGVSPASILEHGLIDAITIVGDRMAEGTAFIPEVLLAARAMTVAVGVLAPHLAASGEQQRGRVLIGTVTGDMHDIGKNLVVTMLRGVGFEVRDLGVNVARQTFYEQMQEFEPHVLALSSLLTTTMMEMPAIVVGMNERRLRGQCKIIVGGAPVSEQFALQIGADGYAPNAVEAVRLVKRLVQAVPTLAG
ncbi:MAG: cobalamin-dependent protein [Burkholderiales bacterium]|nr:cobalamin-dependent protein [Burkholderiales bacterium]